MSDFQKWQSTFFNMPEVYMKVAYSAHMPYNVTIPSVRTRLCDSSLKCMEKYRYRFTGCRIGASEHYLWAIGYGKLGKVTDRDPWPRRYGRSCFMNGPKSKFWKTITSESIKSRGNNWWYGKIWARIPTRMDSIFAVDPTIQNIIHASGWNIGLGK